MTFTGTVTAINTALAGLSFNPTTSFTGAATLQIVTSDQGNTGTGGALTDTDTVTITVDSTSASSPPTRTSAGRASRVRAPTRPARTPSSGAARTSGPPGPVPVPSVPMTGDGRLTARVVTDTNPHTAAKAGVMIRNTLTAGSVHAMMSLTRRTAPSSSPEPLTRRRRRTPTGTPAATRPYWVRITRVGNTFKGERSPDGTTWTQQGTTQTITMGSTIYVGLAVTVAHQRRAPHRDLRQRLAHRPVPPVLSASGGTTAHTENVPVVVDSGITVTDTDDTNMASGTVTVGTGYTAGQDVLAFTNQNGITGSWSAPTMTLTGSATKANWQTALRSITYNNTSNTPNTGNRTINFVVNDGSFNSNTAAKTVSVAAVNDAPVNSVPGAQTTAMNTPKVFSTGNGNLISVADVDAAAATIQVQLVSTNGATTLSTLPGSPSRSVTAPRTPR